MTFRSQIHFQYVLLKLFFHVNKSNLPENGDMAKSQTFLMCFRHQYYDRIERSSSMKLVVFMLDLKEFPGSLFLKKLAPRLAISADNRNFISD